MRNFLLDYLRYLDPGQIMIHRDFNRLKGFFLLRVCLKYVYRPFNKSCFYKFHINMSQKDCIGRGTI